MTQEVLYTRHAKNKSIDYNIHPQHPVKADTHGRKLMDLLNGMEGRVPCSRHGRSLVDIKQGLQPYVGHLKGGQQWTNTQGQTDSAE